MTHFEIYNYLRGKDPKTLREISHDLKININLVWKEVRELIERRHVIEICENGSAERFTLRVSLNYCPVCHKKIRDEERHVIVGEGHRCALTAVIEVQHKYRRTPDKYQFFYIDRPQNKADVWFDVYQIPTQPVVIKGDTLKKRVGQAIRWVRDYLKHNVGRQYSQLPTEDFINTWAVLIILPDSFDCKHVRPMVEYLTDKDSLYQSCEFVANYLR